ncbi:MAG: VTT domain-containing protein, partial [Rhodospirillales bacterium]
MNASILIRGLALFVSLVVLGVVLKTGVVFNEAWIDSVIRSQGLKGVLIFVAVGWGVTSVGLPRQLVAFLGGYAFGFVYGTGLALAATTLGCITAFLFARVLARDWVAGKISDRIRRIDGFLSENPFSMTLLIRFLPLGSNFLTNLAAGVSSVSWAPFVAGSALGYIP